jgi:PKD repeat protein
MLVGAKVIVKYSDFVYSVGLSDIKGVPSYSPIFVKYADLFGQTTMKRSVVITARSERVIDTKYADVMNELTLENPNVSTITSHLIVNIKFSDIYGEFRLGEPIIQRLYSWPSISVMYSDLLREPRLSEPTINKTVKISLVKTLYVDKLNIVKLAKPLIPTMNISMDVVVKYADIFKNYRLSKPTLITSKAKSKVWVKYADISITKRIQSLRTIMLPVNKPPIADFMFSPTPPSVGELITFHANLSYDPDGGNLVSYNWDFGDGNKAQGKVVYHKYDKAGEYTVKLTVKDEEGLTATKEITITVQASLKPIITKVQPKIGGIVLKSISFENTYTASIQSETPINRVIFKLNGREIYTDTDSSDGWSARINTSLFEKDSILEVIAVDRDGVQSDPYTLKIRVIGIPDWLNWFIKYGRVSVSSNGIITFEKYIPNPPVDASLSIPDSIPVIGGEQRFKAQSKFAIVYEIPSQAAIVAGEGILSINVFNRKAEGRIGTEGTVKVPEFELKSARIWGYVEIEVFSQTWTIPKVPIVGTIRFDVGVSPHAKIEANISAETSVSVRDGSIYPGTKAEGEAKLDFKVAKVEIGGKGDLTGKIHVPAPYDPGITASISAYGRVRAGMFEAGIKVGPYEYIYPSRTKTLTIPDEYVRVSGWKLTDKYGGIPAYRVGVKSLSSIMTSNSLAQTEYGRLTLNNLEDENPSVVYIDGSYLVVWSAQDPQKDVKAGHDLYYATYSLSTGWSAIGKLTNDYLDDRNPVLARFGDKVVCIWTIVNRDLRNENITSPFDIFPYVEIAYSIYNGTWSSPIILTNNSEFEFNLDVYSDNENISIAWEVDKDLNFSTFNDRVVKLSLLNGTSLLEISNATKPSLAGNYIVYYNPVDNKLNFASISPFEVITSYNVSDVVDLDLSCYNNSCTLVWIGNFEIFYANPPNSAVKLDSNLSAYTIDVEDFGNYKLLVFSGKSPGDVRQRIFYRIGYNGYNNTWIDERALAGGTNLTFWQTSYAYDNSGFLAVFAGKERMDDKNDIFNVYHKYAGDLKIEANVSGNYSLGDYVTVNFTVKNVGDWPVSAFTVEIYNLNMNKFASKSFNGLDVGGSIRDSFNVSLDESGGFIIKVPVFPDLDMNNNVVEIVLLHPDLTVKRMEESRVNERLIINTTLENMGAVGARNVTFKLQNGNRTIYSDIIDLISSSGFVNRTMAINITDLDRNLTSCIVMDPEDEIIEEREDNNIYCFRTLMTDLSVGDVKAIDDGSGVILKVLVGNSGIGDSIGNLTVLDANLTPIKFVAFTINGSNVLTVKEVSLTLSYDEWNETEYIGVEDGYDVDYGNNIAKIEKILLKMPVAKFTYEPSIPFAGKPLLFKSSSYAPDGNITIYIWNFGDGNIISTNSTVVKHIFKTTGNYTVTLTVIDDHGISNSTSKNIIVEGIGDFNGNGVVDIADVSYVAYIVVGKMPQDLRADFNKNGRVDIGDLVRIAYYTLKKIDKI